MAFHLTLKSTIQEFSKRTWQRLSANQPPFLQFEFFAALEDSESIGEASGWIPRYGQVTDEHNEIVAVFPAFEKLHSYGEYLFDHAWANAYHQHGLAYYPKLLVAAPFTPVTGNKLMVAEGVNKTALTEYVFTTLKAVLDNDNYSSAHWLFDAPRSEQFQTDFNYSQRVSVQFQWQNHDYLNFDAFLARFTSRKRKDIRKERRKVSDQGIDIKCLSGDAISAEDMQFFYLCYCQTYLKRSGHTGYLTEAFFEQIYATLRRSLMVVMAYRDEKPVAAALYLWNETGLFGRYWGCIEEVDGLHFECCYYSGIEFAIERKLPIFNPGTQGEHKLLRGFEPIRCYSLHHCKEPAFQQAVEQFVKQETLSIEHYFAQARSAVPFKQTE
ncbi:GNAT family N-acetyltransferase [Alteromonas sp. ASW11-36]|uniref:GNAT family N-acetyltransferase n=1 Tax=Alteromonas arenosi TaxID=3055817 RepID=A0ABT7SV78_9ALTE|nr:GNAT family N-acetyltransferase [Alteromonas sp. ASW11-36]MDM7860095.1 GNAT family N-acetyltransferase [Alteromonas sp. ASW11-36]